MTSKAEYLEWKKTSASLGCMFARLIAVRPEDYGQVIESVTTSSSPGHVASCIAARVDSLIADPSAHSAALLLPGIQDIEVLAKAMLELNGHPNWEVKGWPLPDYAPADLAAISVTREVPRANGETLPSEALVLGPFPGLFPPTRCAPITAFEIFTGNPLPFDPKDSTKEASKANLAHIPVDALGEHARDRLWEMSRAARLKSLGGDEDCRAKAKVALVIPRPLAVELGLTQ